MLARSAATNCQLLVLATGLVVCLAGCESNTKSNTTPDQDTVRVALTATDIIRIEAATQSVLEDLPSNESQRWQNPASSHDGEVTPLRTIRIESPRGYCRVYNSRVFDRVSQDQLQLSIHMACRKSRNVWIPCTDDARSCVQKLRQP